jgi:hypothetical protein
MYNKTIPDTNLLVVGNLYKTRHRAVASDHS